MKTKIVLFAIVSLCATAFGANDYIINPKVAPAGGGPGAVNVILRDTTGAYVAAGGGGAGGAVTIADGADVAEGLSSDVIGTAGGTGTVSSKLRLMTNQLASILTGVTGATPAGTNVIGKVSIDQTTPGTTNLVAANNTQLNGVALLAGNGVTGTGSQRVTIASDNTAFSVNANAGTNLNTSALLLDATMGLAQASTTSGQKGPLVQAAVTTANPAYTTAQTDPLSMTTTGGLRVDISSTGGNAVTTNQGATGAGTFRVTLASDAPGVQATGSAVNARGFYDTGIAKTANPANATDGNAVGMMMDKAGRPVTTPSAVRELVGIQQTNIATTSETTFITAAGASVFADLTDLIITTAGAAAQTITVKDVTAGTTRMVLNYPNAAVAPGQPLVLHFSPPIPQATANSAWTITNSAATAINVTAVFVKNL